MGRIESMAIIRFKQTLMHVFRSEVAIPERLLTSIQKCVNDESHVPNARICCPPSFGTGLAVEIDIEKLDMVGIVLAFELIAERYAENEPVNYIFFARVGDEETKEYITRRYRVGDNEEEVRMLLENGMFIDDFVSEMLGKTILHRVRRMKEKQRKIFGELG